MSNNLLRVLQVYLGMVALFHAVTGLGINVAQPFMEMTAKMYGAEVDFTPQFVAILHPLGAFMFVLGLLAAAAAMDPLRYRAISYGFAALFVIRALQRVVFKTDLEQAFHIAATRNMINIGFFLAMGITLALLQRAVESRSSEAAAMVR